MPQNSGLNARRWTLDAMLDDPTRNRTAATYAWLEHILWHLAPKGTAGVVLANGSMSSSQSACGGWVVLPSILPQGGLCAHSL
jgi:type I restriction-modification system DNA methylase subunit